MVLKIFDDKKGLTMQLHWIFILVAGGIILVFFFSIAGKQKALSDDKLSLSLVSSVDSIFDMADASESTSQFISIPKDGLSFSCSDSCDCFFSSGSARRSFGSSLIFSESFIDSSQAVVWSLPWKVPFRVANFLYVTNPETRKIVVFDDSSFAVDLKKKLMNVLPDNIFFEFLSVSDFYGVSDDGSSSIRVFFLGRTSPFLPQSLRDSDVSLVGITPQTINFYDYVDGSVVAEGFFNYPSDMSWILAALFSEDEDMFVCEMKSAFERLNFVADIFHKRAVILQEKSLSDLGLVCLYPVEKLAFLIDLTEDVLSKDENDLYTIVSQINVLEDELGNFNDNLIRNSCPELF